MGHYSEIRIPRKLKKQIKQNCGIHWSLLDINQRYWLNLSIVNIKHRNYLISKLCEKKNQFG